MKQVGEFEARLSFSVGLVFANAYESNAEAVFDATVVINGSANTLRA
jgi:hypothetical protein